MGIFGYIMLAAFILFWVVLLVKFLRMTSSAKSESGDEDQDV